MLIVSWSALVLAVPAVVASDTRGAESHFRQFSGLFEWTASASLFLFLLSTALLFPEESRCQSKG